MANPLTYANSDEYILVNPNDPKVGHLIYDAPMVDADTKQFIRDPETGKIKVYRMVIWGTKGLTQAQVEALITEKNASMVTKVNTLETRVTNFLDADDSTLDQLSELITEIKANRANIALITSNKATKEELQQAVNTINSNIANSYVDLVNSQTIIGNKIFTGEVNVPTVASSDNSTKAASTAFVQEALGALTGTSVENLVTKNAEQTITGLKTFSTLPQSSVVPSDDKDLVNKKYVDDAVPTNMVTTDTTQIVSGVKTFNNAIIGSITGNAATATKATQDSDGNTIKTTYAKLNSPALTGTPTAPTASVATNNTQVATTAFVKSQGYLTSHQSLDSCVKTSGNQTVAGIKTFSSVPVCATNPTANNQLANKAYVDGKPSKYLGEQIVSYLPLSDAKAHLLDGAVLNKTNYPEFITYVEALYAGNSSLSCFTTESTWQANVTANGVCSKFVVNTTKHTVRLPKMGSQILTKGTTQSISAKTLSANIGLSTSVTLSGSTGSSSINMTDSNSSITPLSFYLNSNKTGFGHYMTGGKTILGSGHTHTLSGAKTGTATLNQSNLNSIASNLSVSSNHFEDVYYYIVVKN